MVGNNKRSLSSVYRPCTNGRPRRGKVFLPTSFPAASVEQQNVVAADDLPPPSSSSNCHVDEAVPTAEDYANLFFGSDDDDDSLTGNSIHSLTMQHHHWEPEPHLHTSTAASVVPLIPPRHRHKRRRVSFTTATPTVHSLRNIPPSSTMTPLEKSASWLQSSDIETLKSSAQSTIQTVRNRVTSNAREYKHRHKFRALMLTFENETDSSIRGLEHKVYRRKETRRMLIQDVIECQHHINGLARFGHVISIEEKRTLLANASLQKSVGCVKKALLDANDDYKEVYNRTTTCLPSPLGAAAYKIRRVSSGVVQDDGVAKSS